LTRAAVRPSAKVPIARKSVMRFVVMDGLWKSTFFKASNARLLNVR